MQHDKFLIYFVSKPHLLYNSDVEKSLDDMNCMNLKMAKKALI